MSNQKTIQPQISRIINTKSFIVVSSNKKIYPTAKTSTESGQVNWANTTKYINANRLYRWL